MKLGISSFSFSWAVGVAGNMPEHPLTFRRLIERTKEYGLSLLQIGDNLPLDALPIEELEECRTLAMDNGIDIEVGTRGLTDEILEKYLDLAVYFASPILRIVIDLNDYAPNVEEIVDILKKWMPEFEKAKIILAIENHDRFEAKTLRYILDTVNSRYVGICLDAANSLGALEGIETVAEELIPYTVNLHAKDVGIIRLPSQLGFVITGRPAGDGAIDMAKLIAQVRRYHPEANCILEQWTAFDTDIETTIANEKKSADKAVAYLKRFFAEHEMPEKISFGASASYTISMFGKFFDVNEVCRSMVSLGLLGFRSFQPELSFEYALDEWENGGYELVNRAQKETGVKVKQMICHFVLDYFESADKVFSAAGYDEIRRFISLCGKVDNCSQILFPVGPLPMEEKIFTHEYIEKLFKAYIDKLYAFAVMAQRAGFRVSFELLPMNFLGSYNAFFEAMEFKGLENFGVNFDTAHAIANGEDIYRLAEVYGSRIFLTHLGDPAIKGGRKLPAGQGMINWRYLLQKLLKGGYSMELDLEIMSDPENTEKDYSAGLKHITEIIQNERNF